MRTNEKGVGGLGGGKGYRPPGSHVLCHNIGESQGQVWLGFFLMPLVWVSLTNSVLLFCIVEVLGLAFITSGIYLFSQLIQSELVGPPLHWGHFICCCCISHLIISCLSLFSFSALIWCILACLRSILLITLLLFVPSSSVRLLLTGWPSRVLPAGLLGV